jgi:release factor glutamine methyltransferase
VLDLGTGSGCIVLSLLAERPGAAGIGTDRSSDALIVARDNAARLGLSDRVGWRLGNWYEPVEGVFDLIVANPPYIAADEMPGLAPEVRDWDPATALTDGGDGLSAYPAILAGVPGRLAPGGRVIVEIGHRQGSAVSRMFRAAGLEAVAVHADLSGRDRAVIGRKPRHDGVNACQA